MSKPKFKLLLKYKDIPIDEHSEVTVLFRNGTHTNKESPEMEVWKTGTLTVEFFRDKPFKEYPSGPNLINITGCTIPSLCTRDLDNGTFSIEEYIIEIPELKKELIPL